MAASRDPHRPRYHFSPDNWMNDPVPFYWDGLYHNFFQYNPDGAYSANKHWGHAASRDLVHWDERPIAIAPTPHGPDQGGVWTGCVVEHAGTFYAFHTGIPQPEPRPAGATSEREPLRQVQCLATSRDLDHWEKLADSVIPAPPSGFGECFRDPQVWLEPGAASGGRDHWRMVIGSELPDRQGGAALLYESDDLHRWRYLGVLATSPVERTGHDFECPDFFPLHADGAGGEHVLLSSRGRTWWQTGRYDAEAGRFTAQRWGPVDSQPYYAAKTLLDGQGRRILLGWLREGRPREAQVAAGWSGVLALPRVLSLLPDGTLGQAPVREVEALRREEHRLSGMHLAAGCAGDTVDLVLPRVTGDALEIVAHFRPQSDGDTSTYGVRVRCTPDGKHGVEIAYDPVAGTLGDVPLRLAPGEPLTLRVFADASVVEAFANGRACYTVRTYPDSEDALSTSIFCRGDEHTYASAAVDGIDAWTLAL